MPSRKFLLLAFLLFGAGALFLYAQGNAYTPQLLTYNGPPANTCDVYQIALDLTNGVFYFCKNRVWTPAAAANANINFTGADSFSQQITSTVSTGTAPFSIASTTVVPNLNAQLHGGLTAPASAIMGISDTQTLTNKTLITASSGNNVTSLNAQANSSAVVGTGSAVTLYTYSLPASTIANLKGFRVNVGFRHSTGSALVTYNLQLNGTTIATITNSGLNGGNGTQLNATVLNTGSSTGTAVWSLLDYGLNQVSAGQATTLTGLAWSSSQVLQFTFNVANTDQVTPIFWNVELIQ